MSVQEFFSESYPAAREKFLAACRAAGLQRESHCYPERGPDGSTLATDVVRIGVPDAANLLVLISGAHGVEALCGSACQTGWISGGGYRALPGSTAVLLVHAINCWGAAYLRRNTDGNVDLCRNFMNFDRPLPENPRYAEIHGALACPEHEGPQRDEANRLLAAFREKHGMPAFLAALMGGQFQHPDGFSYGGSAPSWSNETMGKILRTHAKGAERVALVEYHSGLGPYGYGTAVTMHIGADLGRTKDWFGHWLLAPNERDPDSPEEFYRVCGHTTEGYLRLLGDAEVTSIVLEYGTYPPSVSLPILLEDHWLTHHGDADSELGRDIKQRLLEAHHPKDVHWRQAIWDRSQQVITQALAGLST